MSSTYAYILYISLFSFISEITTFPSFGSSQSHTQRRVVTAHPNSRWTTRLFWASKVNFLGLLVTAGRNGNIYELYEKKIDTTDKLYEHRLLKYETKAMAEHNDSKRNALLCASGNSPHAGHRDVRISEIIKWGTGSLV
jgi:hypothetical protein